MLTLASFTITTITVILTVATLYLTWQHIAQIDWKQPFIFFGEEHSIETDF